MLPQDRLPDVQDLLHDDGTTLVLLGYTYASNGDDVRTRFLRLRHGAKEKIGRSSKHATKGLPPAVENAMFDCPVVSRQHAELSLGESTNGRHPDVFITDLGSLHGTTVNRVTLTPHQPMLLRPKDEIHLGQHVASDHGSHNGVHIVFDCLPESLNKPGSPFRHASTTRKGFAVPSDSEDDSQHPHSVSSSASGGSPRYAPRSPNYVSLQQANDTSAQQQRPFDAKGALDIRSSNAVVTSASNCRGTATWPDEDDSHRKSASPVSLQRSVTARLLRGNSEAPPDNVKPSEIPLGLWPKFWVKEDQLPSAAQLDRTEYNTALQEPLCHGEEPRCGLVTESSAPSAAIPRDSLSDIDSSAFDLSDSDFDVLPRPQTDLKPAKSPKAYPTYEPKDEAYSDSSHCTSLYDACAQALDACSGGAQLRLGPITTELLKKFQESQNKPTSINSENQAPPTRKKHGMSIHDLVSHPEKDSAENVTTDLDADGIDRPVRCQSVPREAGLTTESTIPTSNGATEQVTPIPVPAPRPSKRKAAALDEDVVPTTEGLAGVTPPNHTTVSHDTSRPTKRAKVDFTAADALTSVAKYAAAATAGGAGMLIFLSSDASAKLLEWMG